MHRPVSIVHSGEEESGGRTGMEKEMREGRERWRGWEENDGEVVEGSKVPPPPTTKLCL